MFCWRVSPIFSIFADRYYIIFRFCYIIYRRGEEKSKDLRTDFDSLKEFKFPPGVEAFLRHKGRFNDKSMYEQIHSMTNCSGMDAVLEQVGI
ncbi:unnamed protein product [Cylicostephanus goldi]|uniref:Uncharacterized protein n=1 Tax=Cylicostephanus goldi TaxID=71465 RepID=A0A3P6RST3_CYLGO|nr:unnamed protein product [Cylicostephanus goldi]